MSVWRSWLRVAVALVVIAVTGAGSPAQPVAKVRGGFLSAGMPYVFAFPRDHASHPEYQSEWWYYTGHLRAPDGHRFGYELTFFRVGLRPGELRLTATQSRWRGAQVFPAHFAITDEGTGRFVDYERFAREALGAGRASTRHLDVAVDDWWLRGDGPMRLHAEANGDRLDLTQTAEKPPAIHGSDGVSRKAACPSCASHYYSLTRLRSIGTLSVAGTRYQVDGLSWMDHEFGSAELQSDQAGWDWFAIQLDDGREVMLYRLRQRDGGVTPQSSGTLIERDGGTTHLTLDRFTIQATGTWTSPHTNGRYPSGWRVRVPSAGLDLVIDPTVRDQELAGTQVGVSYWEGSCTVRRPDGSAAGAAYVELTGYAGGLSL